MTVTRLAVVVSLALSIAATLVLAADPARAQDLQGTLKKIRRQRHDHARLRGSSRFRSRSKATTASRPATRSTSARAS